LGGPARGRRKPPSLPRGNSMKHRSCNPRKISRATSREPA
jgi:hypothetical protein